MGEISFFCLYIFEDIKSILVTKIFIRFTMTLFERYLTGSTFWGYRIISLSKYI